MAYKYKLPLTYFVNNSNNCTLLFAKYIHVLSHPRSRSGRLTDAETVSEILK
jgi:hypothetical protein